MADFKTDLWGGASFSVPDSISVRKQLRWQAVFQRRTDDDLYLDAWNAALPLIENWQSETIPDPRQFDPETETNPNVAKLVIWAASQVSGHMTALDDIPKNS